MQHAQRAIFISYARKDGEEHANALRQRLEGEAPDAGPIWQDRARMEGGRPWWTQIEGALDRARFLVLIMTTGAVESRVVREEWSYARRQGVCVYPVLAASKLDFTALPRWMAKAHFFDLDKQWPTFLQHLRSPCQPFRQPFMAPELPAGYVARPREMARLREQTLAPPHGDPVPGTILLTGAGGFGKSTLAAALCHDPTIREAFDDGILWVTLGEQQPDGLGSLTAMCCALADETKVFANETVAAYELAQKLESRDCLIIIDDVWRESDLEPFLRGGRRSTRIITTRLRGLGVDARIVEVGELSAGEAETLLLGREQTKNPGAFREFAGRLGNWPLLLALAAAALRRAIRNGESADSALANARQLYQEQGAEAFDQRNASDRRRAVARSLDTSLEFLSRAEQDEFVALAVFPPERETPLSTLSALWGKTTVAARKQVEEFADLSLLRFDARGGTVRLHAVIQAAMKVRMVDAAGWHAKLLRSWGDPRSLPDDYAWRWLGYHMMEAGQAGAFRELLFRWEWIEAKLIGADLAALIADYDLPPKDEELRLVQGALRLSAHVVLADASQLPGQLLGRLMGQGSASVAALLEDIRRTRPPRSLCPFTAELTPPGGALLLTLTGHAAEVTTVTLTPDERFIVSGSGYDYSFPTPELPVDNSIRIWDIESGVLLRTLTGHDKAILMVVVTRTAAGLRILSASADGTLREWDFDIGEELRRIDLPKMPCYTMTRDGRRILSSSGKSIVEWDLESGQAARTFEGHAEEVTAVSLTADNRRMISAGGRNEYQSSEIVVWDFEQGKLLQRAKGPARGCQAIALAKDGRHALVGPPYWETYVTIFHDVLKLWDLDCEAEALTLVGHREWVQAIAVSSDARRAVTASSDKTIKIWDLTRNPTQFTAPAHPHEVRAVAFTPDGKGAISASGSVYKPGEIKHWDVASRKELCALEGHERGILALAVTPDSRFAISGSYDETVKVWSLRRRRLARTLPRHSTYVNAVATSPDGRSLFAASGWGVAGDFYEWNRRTGKLVQKLIGENIMGLAITPDGQYAVCAGIEGTVLVWDLRCPEREWMGVGCQLRGHTSAVRAVAVAPDGNRAISGSADGTVRVWAIDQYLKAKPLQHELDRAVRDLCREKGHSYAQGVLDRAEAFLREPQDFAALDEDVRKMTGLLFSLSLFGPRADAMRILATHTDAVNAVAVTADGRFVVSGSADHSVRVWELETGQAVAGFTLESRVLACAVSPDGHVILAGDEAGRLHFLEFAGADMAGLGK
jgi:WD40 repeat protein